MKKTIMMMVAMLVMAGSLSAAPTSKEFTRGLTTEVSIDGMFRVVMSDQYRNNVRIEFDDLLAEHIVTEVKCKQHKIYYTRSANKIFKQSNVAPATVYIDRNFASYLFKDAVYASSSELVESATLKIRLNGACTLDARISAGKLDMAMSGSAQYIGEVSARDAKLVLSGASTARMSGAINKLTVSVAGSSIFDGTKLDNQSGVTLTASGASNVTFASKGSAKVNVAGTSSVSGDVICKALTVNQKGSSSVKFKGSAKTLKLSIAGTSRFEKSDFAADMSAKIAADGTASVYVESRGSADIKAKGAAVVEVECGSNIKIAASDTANVTHNPNAKLVKLTLKDQATVRAREDEKQTVNVFASPYGPATPHYQR